MGDKICWRQNLSLFSKNVQIDSKEIVWIHDIGCLLQPVSEPKKSNLKI